LEKSAFYYVSDNVAAVHNINKCSTVNHAIMPALRQLFWLSAIISGIHLSLMFSQMLFLASINLPSASPFTETYCYSCLNPTLMLCLWSNPGLLTVQISFVAEPLDVNLAWQLKEEIFYYRSRSHLLYQHKSNLLYVPTTAAIFVSINAWGIHLFQLVLNTFANMLPF